VTDPTPLHVHRDCVSLRDLAVAWVDGVLRGAERERLVAHLEACPDCRAMLSADAALRRRVRRIPPDRAPEALRTRLEGRRRPRP
jgi:anti-sigma factor (TIGR02949 family)